MSKNLLLNPFISFAIFCGFSNIQAASLGEKDAQLSQKVKALFEERCEKCHSGESPSGGLDILNFKQIFQGKGDSEEVIFNATKPEASLLYKRIADDSMPKGSKSKKLSTEEKALVLNWLKTEADQAVSFSARAFISDKEIENYIFNHLKDLTKAEAADARYITLTNLYNRTGADKVSDETLESHRQAIFKLVNSLSREPKIVVPVSIDPAKTILKISLRDYGWTPQLWEEILSFYPYGVLYDNVSAEFIRSITKTSIPAVRADWFAARASIPPLYHKILRLPETDLALENELGIEVKNNISNRQVERAGFRGGTFPGGSGVSDNNRLIERHTTSVGSYWKSYDFSSSENEQNLLNRPLGPGAGTFDFKQAGGEIIFNLPNGMQAYLIANAAGKRLDSAPETIVRDKTNQGRAVVNGLSCISCHSEGMNRNYDQVIAHINGAPDSFDNQSLTEIRKLYKDKATMDAAFNKSDEEFKKALAAAKVTVTREPVFILAREFEGPVTFDKAASEVGLKSAELNQLIAQKPALQLIQSALQNGGATRSEFIAVFNKTILELGLGTPQVSSNAPISTAGRKVSVKLQHKFDSALPMRAAAFSPTGDKLATVSNYDKTSVVTVWNAQTYDKLYEIKSSPEIVLSLAFSPNGSLLATGAYRDINNRENGYVRLYNAETGTEQPISPGRVDSSAIRSVEFSPDGTGLLYASGGNLVTKLIDTQTGDVIREFNISLGLRNASFNSDGSKILFTSTKTVSVVETETGKELLSYILPQGNRILSSHINSSGSILAMGLQHNGVELLSATDGDLIKAIPSNTEISRVRFSPDGTMLLTTDIRGAVKLFSVPEGKLLSSVTTYTDNSPTAIFDRQGRFIFTSGERTARLFKIFFAE